MSPSGAESSARSRAGSMRSTPSAVREQLRQRRRRPRRARGRGVGDRPHPGRQARARSRYLESRIEGAAPDRAPARDPLLRLRQPLGWAARTLIEDLGYKNVESMTGGITLWKDRGYEVETPRALTAEQRDRYSRHLLLPEVGVEGQQKLLDAKVLLLGAGGLGSPTALYLAAAGVGHARDRRRRRRRPLQPAAPGDPHDRPGRRAEGRLGRGRRSRRSTRTSTSSSTRSASAPDNIMEILQATTCRRRARQLPDALPAQRRLGAAADPGRVGRDPRLRRASCRSSSPTTGPCYRCLFPMPPPAELAPSCGANGVLGVLPGTMGLLQATEVIKLILGVGDPLIGRLLLYDALGRDDHRGEGPPRSRLPDLLARAGEISDEEMGVFPDYEAFCAAAGLGFRSPWPPFKIPPVLRASVGGEQRGDAPTARPSARSSTRRRRGAPGHAVAAVRRRRRAQPLRQRLPQRRGRARARRARDGRRRGRHAGDPAGDGGRGALSAVAPALA